MSTSTEVNFIAITVQQLVNISEDTNNGLPVEEIVFLRAKNLQQASLK